MSFIQFETLLDPDALREAVETRIERKRENLVLIDLVFKICEKHEGRKITKRIATDLSKLVQMAAYTIYYRHEHGMYNLIVWGQGLPYKERLSALIGYDECPTVDMGKIREYNQCYTLDAGRIKQLKKGIYLIPLLVARWNDAVRQLQDVNKEAEGYLLQYDIEIKADRRR